MKTSTTVEYRVERQFHGKWETWSPGYSNIMQMNFIFQKCKRAYRMETFRKVKVTTTTTTTEEVEVLE